MNVLIVYYSIYSHISRMAEAVKEGASGMGAYHGSTSFDTFSHSKSILMRSNLFDMLLQYPPYGNKELLKWLFRVIG